MQPEVKDEKDVRYVITPFGLASRALKEHEGKERADFFARTMLDAIELHLRRHYAKDGGTGAMILDGKDLTFGTVHGGDDAA